MRYWRGLFVLLFLLSGCIPKHQMLAVVPTPVHPTQQTRVFSVVSALDLQGLLNIQLTMGCKKTELVLHGDARDLAHVVTTVSGNALLIHLGKGDPDFGAVTAHVCLRQLNSFTYNGAGTITGHRLHSTLLDLSIKNQGRTELDGDLVLRHLSLAGNGLTQIKGIHSTDMYLQLKDQAKLQLSGMAKISYLSMNDNTALSFYWVKSSTLVIRAHGKAYIQLAGIAQRLDMKLYDNARFNGRYLRANRAFVNTNNQSVAEIAAVEHQHTLARDASNIYFYNIPGTKADFMVNEGSVLDMRDWNMPFMQEYNRYNI